VGARAPGAVGACPCSGMPPGVAYARVGCRVPVAPWASISGTRGRVSQNIFGQFPAGAAVSRRVPGGRCRVGVSPYGINAACRALESLLRK
jgi:hypothetical protein